MAQLAMALGTSHLVPLPVFAHSLNAMLVEVHRPGTSTSDAPTFLEAGHIWTRLSSSTARNSIKANTPAEPVETSVYADAYLYVQSLCYLVIVQATVLLAASISVVTYLDGVLLGFVQWRRVVSAKDLPDDFSLRGEAVWNDLLLVYGRFHEVFPRYKQWWLSIDIQQQDVMRVCCDLAGFWMYV
jgi:hypothetical protein